MNERGWFTLLVRGGGVVLTVMGVLRLAAYGSSALSSWWYMSSQGSGASLGGYSMAYQVSQVIVQVVPLLLGVYFLFFAGWMIDRMCRSVCGRCRRCGYDLADDPPVCPECGLRSP
ncbi:MAG: hypothetical protein R3B57_10350 [Phycisphaerales bacterium]